jgi:predicted RNase H-like nuclease (RuvC/YqgF family)
MNTCGRGRIEELEDRIRELKARLPRHSARPSMLMELEELEDELAQLRDEEIGDETTDTECSRP